MTQLRQTADVIPEGMRLLSHPLLEPLTDKVVFYTHSPSVRIRLAGIRPRRSWRYVRRGQDTGLGPGKAPEAVRQEAELVRILT